MNNISEDKNIDEELLKETVSKMMASGKGILAIDESNKTADKRLESIEVEGGSENRMRYRELFLSMEGLEKYVSGTILYDETFWQSDSSGKKFVEILNKKGIVPGIKVDTGAKDFPGFPGEKITYGLDGFSESLEKYFESGARFTKWRAVIKIDEENGLPTEECVKSNVEVMARYARLAQESGLVPIVEPEVLLLGKHSLEKSEEVTSWVLGELFRELEENKIYFPGLVLKTSMVISGNENPDESSPEEVASKTVKVLKDKVPPETGGVVFLSGGQTPVEATAHLDKIAEMEPLPWPIAFSYARALQGPALEVWEGDDDNKEKAREEFKKRLELNHLADLGKYEIDLEYLD